MDRPSALDLAFLDLETDRAPLHVGWTLRFDGQPPALAALRRHLDGRLGAVPKFRRRLARGAYGLGDLHWVDDPVFDVARHVHAVTLPAPGGAGELRDSAGALLSTRLPIDQPLWRMYLVDGLADGWAIVGQAHHVLVDGIAAIQVALLLFDGLAPTDTATWVPAPVPAPQALATHAAARRFRGAAELARSVAGAVAGGGAGGATRDALRVADAARRPSSPTTLDRSATPDRLVAYGSVDFEDARAAGRRHGATVNDVLLAASTIALRRALVRRGEDPDRLKVLVPVSVREDDDGVARSNAISFLAIDLPVGEADPVRVLRLLRARTGAAKANGEARPITALTRAADLLPSTPRRALTRAAVRAAAFDGVVSNVPGPPVALTLLGRPLRAIHPLVPIIDGTSIAIGAVSYAGRLHLGLACDAAIVPEAVDVARDLERAFDTIRMAEGPGPTPWRARARSRRDRHLTVVPD